MSIDNKQVEHLSHLARIELTADEKNTLTKDLGDILAYFEKLKALDTSNIEPTSQSIKLNNITRLDEVKPCKDAMQKKIIDNFPDSSGRFIKVNKVI
jgi:aspartyl-tRNA(Asn)/glutamyl-tRNA(Gln) amidotransferase subunit C